MAIQALADGRVLAERIGEVPPRVVALHGWGRSGADFVPVLAGLDAVAIHLPGFGPTASPDAVWGTPEYAELVVDAIRPFSPVVLVGHSFGGRIAVRIAAKYPELVSGLVLTGAPLVRLAPTGKPKLSYRLAKWANRVGLLSDTAMEARRRKAGSADYNAAQGVMRDIMVKTVNENYDDDLARITAPTWMVWGEHDTAAPTAAGKVASERVRGARWIVVPGEEHLFTPALRAAVRTATEEALA
ncbi:MAG: alpha/beta fold hydrolase [Microbacteriaceae bacterium]